MQIFNHNMHDWSTFAQLLVVNMAHDQTWIATFHQPQIFFIFWFNFCINFIFISYWLLFFYFLYFILIFYSFYFCNHFISHPNYISYFYKSPYTILNLTEIFVTSTSTNIWLTCTCLVWNGYICLEMLDLKNDPSLLEGYTEE